MDTFMDKLAQKLTAQEMIKANTAADVEEMNKLKSQAKEYREILDQMQKLVEESFAKMNQIQVETQDNEKVQEALNLIEQSVHASADQIDGSITRLEAALSEKVDNVFDGKLEGVNENIHKECVKVYRNVQAVVVEENNKQSEGLVLAVNALKGKLSAVLGVSIVALLAAVGGLVFQILVYLQVI